MCVAVDGAFGYFEFMLDDPGVAPLEECFFDGVAVGVVADGAASLVVPEVNFVLGFGLGLWSRGGGAGGVLFECWDWAGLSFWVFSWFCTFGLYCGLSMNTRSTSLVFRRRSGSGASGFRVRWFRVGGDHNRVAAFFEGFYGGFEGGEAVEQVGWFFGCRSNFLGWRVRRIGWGSLGDRGCLGGCGVSGLRGCILSRRGELDAGIRLVSLIFGVGG